MLNIGQIVVDLDKNELMIFAGLEILQDQKTGECTAYHAFIMRDKTYVCGKTKETRRNYTNFAKGKDGRIPVGSFIDKQGLDGCYLGIIGKEKIDKEIMQSAVDAIKEFEEIGWELREGKPVLMTKEVL